MTYDENVFKEKANRKARKIWIVFAVLLSANYGSDASGGLYPTTSYLIFLALCWLPLIFEVTVFPHIKRFNITMKNIIIKLIIPITYIHIDFSSLLYLPLLHLNL